MISIQIKTNYQDVQREFRGAPDKILKPALSKAINDSLKRGISEFAKYSASGSEVTPYMVRKGIKTIRANQRTLTGVLQATGKPIPIKAYRPRKTSTGVRVTMQGKVWNFASAFRIKRFGNNWVNRARDKRTPYATTRRKRGTGPRKDPRPIRLLMGPALANNIADSAMRKVAQRAQSLMQDRTNYHIKRGLSAYLRKVKAKVR